MQTISLKRLKAGSYETEDGQYFTYSYNSENGEGKWWVLYKKKTEQEDDDTQIGFGTTLREVKRLLTEELEYRDE